MFPINVDELHLLAPHSEHYQFIPYYLPGVQPLNFLPYICDDYSQTLIKSTDEIDLSLSFVDSIPSLPNLSEVSTDYLLAISHRHIYEFNKRYSRRPADFVDRHTVDAYYLFAIFLPLQMLI